MPTLLRHLFATPLAAVVLLVSGVAMAQDRPPAGAMPLSQIIAMVETRPGLLFIEEVEWDDDGYWEVELRGTDGSKTKLRLDPMTGTLR